MAGARRHRRFLPRQDWIRRRIWSKQRGTKLRSSGSESDGNSDPVVKPVLRDGDAASKLVLKVGGGGDDGAHSPKSGSDGHDVADVGEGGGGGSYGPNTGSCGCHGIPKHVVEVGGGSDDANCSAMLGSCGRNRIRKRVVEEEGGSYGTCALNSGSCRHDGSPKHVVQMAIGDGIEQARDGRNVRGRRIGRGRLRVDCDGQLYVLDSEAEDSDLEESCRPEFRRGLGSRVRQLAATGKVALEEGTIKATTVARGEWTEEMQQCKETWLTGIEGAEDREVLGNMIKVALLSFYYSY